MLPQFVKKLEEIAAKQQILLIPQNLLQVLAISEANRNRGVKPEKSGYSEPKPAIAVNMTVLSPRLLLSRHLRNENDEHV
ncbi:hypothetical protein HK100_007343, partial [Physocladia obscura]